MRRYLLGLPLLLGLFSCDISTYTPLYSAYHAEFEPALTDDVAALMHDIAGKWELRIFDEDRNQYRYLTKGVEAFEIFLSYEDGDILVIGNAGIGTVLTLHATDWGKMPLDALEALTAEVIDELERRFGLEFCVRNLETSLCHI